MQMNAGNLRGTCMNFWWKQINSDECRGIEMNADDRMTRDASKWMQMNRDYNKTMQMNADDFF